MSVHLSKSNSDEFICLHQCLCNSELHRLINSESLSKPIVEIVCLHHIFPISNHCHWFPYKVVLCWFEFDAFPKASHPRSVWLVDRHDRLPCPIAIHQSDSIVHDDPNRIFSSRYRDQKWNNVHRKIVHPLRSNAKPSTKEMRRAMPLLKASLYLAPTALNTNLLAKGSATIVQTNVVLHILTLKKKKSRACVSIRPPPIVSFTHLTPNDVLGRRRKLL